jgi:hypothetical protein
LSFRPEALSGAADAVPYSGPVGGVPSLVESRPRRAGTLEVGFGVRSLVPDVSPGQAYWLWGYGSRRMPSAQLHSPIDARAVAFRDSAGAIVALLALDVGAIGLATVERIKSQATAAVRGLDPRAICVNVTHTHGAPAALALPIWPAGIGDVDPGFHNHLVAQSTGAIADAVESLEIADLAVRRTETAIGHDRVFDPGISGFGSDPTLDVVSATRKDGSVIGTIFATGCHPVALGSDNRINADFPGVARRTIESIRGGRAVFLQGYGGTTNPRIGDEDRGESACASVGQQLAREVISAADAADQVVCGRLRVSESALSFPFRKTLAPAQAPAGIPLRHLELVDRWRRELARTIGHEHAELRATVQLLDIGTADTRWRIAACSHEVSSDLAAAVRAADTFGHPTLLGYSNGQTSYLPSDRVLAHPDDGGDFPFALANYEGARSFLWYCHPAPLAYGVDGRVHEGHRRLFALHDTRAA